MNFSQALDALKEGYRVENRSWNGKGMHLALQRPDEHSKMGLPYIYITLPKDHPIYPGKMVPRTPSQLDIMSDGWKICGPEDTA
jgi:hypothetical protein